MIESSMILNLISDDTAALNVITSTSSSMNTFCLKVHLRKRSVAVQKKKKKDRDTISYSQKSCCKTNN